MNAFLASAAAPWIIVMTVLALGILAVRGAGRLRRPLRWMGRGTGGLLIALGCLLALGAGAAHVQLADALRANPPPGKMIDVGGYRVRVLCEGPRTPVTLVWLTGGYSQALWLDGLHQSMKTEVRSCELDRPGVGYADFGGLPLTVDRLTEVVHDALAKAGEVGPLVLAGHSMGGLYAANYAQTYPDQVRGILLLDPTPAAWMVEEKATIGCEPEAGDRRTQLMAMFGLAGVHALNPLYGPQTASERAAFQPKTWDLLATLEAQPKAMIASASAFHFSCEDPFSLVRGPSALGALPVRMVLQTQTEQEVLKEAPAGLTPRQTRNWMAMRRGWPEEYVSSTSQGVLVRAPPGWGHLFPLTHPAFALDQVRALLNDVRPSADALDIFSAHPRESGDPGFGRGAKMDNAIRSWSKLLKTGSPLPPG